MNAAVLLFALVGLAAANHYPGHIDFPASYGVRNSMPAAFAASADEPMVIVTKSSHFEPELVAVVVERGINYLPESTVGLRNMLSEMDETVTLCKSSPFGAVEHCFESPITKVLAPEAFSAMPVTRVLSEMPWYVMGRNNIEIFDMPMLTSRANEFIIENSAADSLPIAFAPIKASRSSLSPITGPRRSFAHADAVDATAVPVSYFTKDALVNSYPLRKAVISAPLSVRKHTPTVYVDSDSMFESIPLRSAQAFNFADSDSLISSHPVFKSLPASFVSKVDSYPVRKANAFNLLNRDALVEAHPLRKAHFDTSDALIESYPLQKAHFQTSDSLADFYPIMTKTHFMPFAGRALPVNQPIIKSLPLFAKKIVA